MPRKFEISLRDWIPYIVRCYYEREPFDLLEVTKSIGGNRRDIGDGQEQLDEIKKVFEYLLKQDFISSAGLAKSGYNWGINFQNQAYKIKPKFSHLIESAAQPEATTQQMKDQIVFNIVINNKSSFINIEKIIEKVVELKASLL
jgi:hypothetical protein